MVRHFIFLLRFSSQDNAGNRGLGGDFIAYKNKIDGVEMDDDCAREESMSAFVFIICIEPDGRDHAHGPKGRPTGFMAPFSDENFSFWPSPPHPPAPSVALCV